MSAAVTGGALMGIGAKFARGCTSGQALTGGALLSAGSWIFIGTCFAGGYLLVWLAFSVAATALTFRVLTRGIHAQSPEGPGGPAQVLAAKAAHIARLQITGHERLAKVLPVGPGADYPVGAGIYQRDIQRPIECAVAAFIAPGETHLGMYT